MSAVSPLHGPRPWQRDVTYCSDYQDACYTFERALAADPQLARVEIKGTRIAVTFVRHLISRDSEQS